jgi:hypothetical protein
MQITRHSAVKLASLCRTAIIFQRKGEGNKIPGPTRHFLYVPLPPFVAVYDRFQPPVAVMDWNRLEFSGIFWIAYKLACI